MLLKKADDKSKRLSLLEDLQKSPLLDTRQKTWLREELMRVRKGIQGEKESAYFLDQHFKGGENHVVLHDLRFVVDGDVAQIDHLILNRANAFYLIETKNYAGSVSINSMGEFTVEYDSHRFGVSSPIEQSRRHERALRTMLERLEITSRIGSAFECYHVVMFHPKAIVNRPPEAEFDTSNVIKADQFPSWHKRFVGKDLGIGSVIRGLANLRSLETIKEWGEKLARQHRPENPLELPEFMHPKQPPKASSTAEPKPRSEVPALKAGAASGFVVTEDVTPMPQPTPSASSDQSDPLCPKCHAPMVRRMAKKGQNAGSQFWGCSKYPACRGTR
jgi:ssDNA-binding Zn-finger/Zn-ribbon topoisomerase 1